MYGRLMARLIVLLTCVLALVATTAQARHYLHLSDARKAAAAWDKPDQGHVVECHRERGERRHRDQDFVSCWVADTDIQHGNPVYFTYYLHVIWSTTHHGAWAFSPVFARPNPNEGTWDATSQG